MRGPGGGFIVLSQHGHRAFGVLDFLFHSFVLGGFMAHREGICGWVPSVGPLFVSCQCSYHGKMGMVDQRGVVVVSQNIVNKDNI